MYIKTYKQKKRFACWNSAESCEIVANRGRPLQGATVLKTMIFIFRVFSLVVLHAQFLLIMFYIGIVNCVIELLS